MTSSRPLAAASGLLLLAWVAARPPAGRHLEPCGLPGEAAFEGIWTTWVECDPETPSRPLRGASPLLFGGTLALNRAPAELLEVLPGIGRARAEAIVAERDTRPFASLADLDRVKGIGPATTAGLVGWATTRPPAPAEAPPQSQKRSQLLPNPSENSYKGRARPARDVAR